MVGRRPEKADIGGRIGQPGRGAGTQLCAGVLQNQMLLDFYLAHFSNIPSSGWRGGWSRPCAWGPTRCSFWTGSPQRSSQPVRRADPGLCKNPRAAGMVNSILRSLERSLERLPTIPQRDPVEYLSILYSHPAWMVREFPADSGGTTALRPCCGPTMRSLPRRPR